MFSSLIKTAIIAGAGVALLAGCASTPAAPAGAGASETPTASASASAPASAAPTDEATPTATETASPSHAASIAPSAPPATNISDRCSTSHLVGTVKAASGGAAGSTAVVITLKNTGTTTCSLQGWAGVSFVGDGNGTQLGAAAAQDRSSSYSHDTVRLAPGARAYAPLKISDAKNFPSKECGVKAADGFRVYPPGSKTALFVKSSGLQACTSSRPSLLTVAALQSTVPSND